MILGVPREIKNNEFRVGLTPESVREISSRGHRVFIETGAGLGIGAGDGSYIAAGAEVVETAADVFSTAEMVIKVKEPQAAERAMLREGQVLFTYLHLAADAAQTCDLVASGATCIAYETVTDANGGLPLLKPMSQVAGRMSIQAGAATLEKAAGGRGVLLGGVPGVAPGKVVVLGGGIVGFNAARMAVGLGAEVTIFDRSVDVLERLDNHFGSRVKTQMSQPNALRDHVAEADLVIGAVLVPGAAAPKLVTRDMLAEMKPGAVMVDVAIDQGGCFDTSRATTYADPTYVVDQIVHYCVANMPGGVARTSTYALNNVTLPLVISIADQGWKTALSGDHHLASGLNIWNGRITHPAVAAEFEHPTEDLASALAA
ncbi:MAG: alanine dehydrogenase [Pseudomonadota bacterium]